MITNTEASVEEPPSTQFGDLREILGCEYVANVLPRPGNGGVIGMGNHRLVTERWIIYLLQSFANVALKQTGLSKILKLKHHMLTCAI